MIFQYSKATNDIQEVENRLVHLSLQHSIELNEALDEPILIEGKARHVGLENINLLLDKLEAEREQWYYCSC